MKKITEDQVDFKSFERIIFELMCRIACELMRGYLELRDKSIMAMRDTKEYRYVETRETHESVFQRESQLGRFF